METRLSLKLHLQLLWTPSDMFQKHQGCRIHNHSRRFFLAIPPLPSWIIAHLQYTVGDPGFPVGGSRPRGGH